MRILTKNLALATLYNAVSIPLVLADLLRLWLEGLGITAHLLVIVFYF